MPKVNGGAQARTNFLISKFKMIQVPNEKDLEARFDYRLPRAPLLIQAINTAMLNEGLEIPNDDPTIEVSKEDQHFIKFLYGLFTPVNPFVDPNEERIHKFELTYEFAITRTFTTRSLDNPEAVLRDRANYQAPTPIVELRTNKSEYWYLITLALRKLCDSPQTSIVWNASQNLTHDAIEWCVDLVYQAVTAQQYTSVEELIQAVKQVCLSDSEYMGKSERALIHCAFRLFNDNDWAGMLGYIIVN